MNHACQAPGCQVPLRRPTDDPNLHGAALATFVRTTCRDRSRPTPVNWLGSEKTQETTRRTSCARATTHQADQHATQILTHRDGPITPMPAGTHLTQARRTSCDGWDDFHEEVFECRFGVCRSPARERSRFSAAPEKAPSATAAPPVGDRPHAFRAVLAAGGDDERVLVGCDRTGRGLGKASPHAQNEWAPWLAGRVMLKTRRARSLIGFRCSPWVVPSLPRRSDSSRQTRCGRR
jgi:hypothetical protein